MRITPTRLPTSAIKSAQYIVHLICTMWLALTFYWGFTDQLGGDPVQSLLDFTGISALNLLLMSLMISPIATYFKIGQLMLFRRPLGVYASVYAFAHFLVFIAFELQFEIKLIVSEIIDRPYITIGFSALLILLVLAMTSPISVRKRLKSRWQIIHNFSYLAATLAAIHFLWLVKSDLTEPLIYATGLLLLLLLRKQKFMRWIKKIK